MQSFLGGATRALTRRPVAAFSHRPGRLQGNGALFSRALSSSSPSSKALTVSQVLSLKPADNAQPAPHVIVNGYVRTIRSMKNVKFVTIGDGHGGTLQAVISPGQAEGLAIGAAVRLAGSWERSPGAGQSHELQVTDVQVLGPSDAKTYPLQNKYHTPDFLRTIPHIRMRSQLNTSLLRLRSDIANTLAQYMASVGCVQTHTPIITSSDCEGAGEVFTVTSADAPSGESKPGQAAEPFFSSPKYLTVSGQLHLEALAQAVGNVWTLSPTFRAEKSDTPRHLSEFYMLEVELAFVDRLDDVMGFLESMVRSIVTSLYDSATASSLRSRHGLKNTEDLVSAETVEQRWRGLMAADWPRITYMQAIEVLRSSGKRFEHMPVWGEPLSTEHEKYLARVVGGDMHKPVFVTAYPRHFKAFYMLPSEDTSPDASCHGGETAECFDLLVPDLCELAGGSLREHRLEPLLATMRARGMALPGETAAGANGSAATPDSSSSAVPADAGVDGAGLGWYVDLRRWGCPPHGGFGLGFDRLLAYLAGVPSVRDVVAFPRWYGRCNC